ncbi:uncharacterized protein MONBRDRAFT_10775 [Monosiga brevicollis MX1]|uniref:MD-2-related lipid-recognition domain-containing protein n=1 Tax=Monosiga brevicollis TaxID=81824 RepID=A9V773_MONBE|nr:uncharacterized protein MONBRDRAFT_10775 [Monosiga brevicollis MX1]EDQ86671.1 predicted protein [Monosiga brevicollis MX1]|eukprot:XP_001748507.1 hypothetical protein [Monosiga brevicollis MX1]
MTSVMRTVLPLLLLVATAQAYFTANIFVVNLLNDTMEFMDCAVSVNGTLPITPDSILPQKVTRFYVNTTESREDVAGYCWWHAPRYGICDPLFLPAPVRSCPYIGWQRTVIAGQEDIDFEVKTPGYMGIGDLTITKRIGHLSKIYCFCDPDVYPDCQQACADL